jgi:hypothetical protein
MEPSICGYHQSMQKSIVHEERTTYVARPLDVVPTGVAVADDTAHDALRPEGLML